MAVVVKRWSKARVEVVMLDSGPEGVLGADITAILSVLHWQGQSRCSQSGAEEVVFLSQTPTRTPLWEVLRKIQNIRSHFNYT